MIEGLCYMLLMGYLNQSLGLRKRVTVGDNIVVRRHHDIYTYIHHHYDNLLRHIV